MAAVVVATSTSGFLSAPHHTCALRPDDSVVCWGADAYAQAEQTRGKAEAEATKIYAAAHQADPEFYELTRTLEAYRKFLDEKTTILLSSDSDLLKYLTSGAAPAATTSTPQPTDIKPATAAKE